MVLTASTTLPVPTDIDTEIERLEQAMKDEIRAMVKAANTKQEAVLRQLQWLKEEHNANLEVCRLRFGREIEQLRRKDSGVIFTPGPIRKLPIELLGYIFRYNVDSDMSPWKLFKVCKDWMSTAMTTPSLWRYILVTLNSTHVQSVRFVVDGEVRLAKGNMQVCYTTSQLLAAIRRSGAVALNIKFHCERNPTESLLPLTSIIFNAPVCERIGILDLGTAFLPGEILPPELSIGRFPFLTEISLSTKLKPWIYALLESVSSTSTRLEKARFGGEVSLELTDLSFWYGLKQLTIHEIEALNHISAKLLKLEEFPVHLYNWPNEKTPASTWANVKSINIRCDPDHLGRLCLPNLESFVFTHVGNDRQQQPAANHIQLSYPRLTKLDVTTSDFSWLSKLSAPLVKDLALTCRSQNPGLPAGHGFPGLQVLTLETNCGGTLTNGILACFPEIDTLCLLGGYKDADFGIQLLMHLEDSSEPVVFPKLIKLSLGNRTSPVYTLKKNAVPLIKKVISSRKRSHRPLAQFSVCWSKNTYTTEQYV